MKKLYSCKRMLRWGEKRRVIIATGAVIRVAIVVRRVDLLPLVLVTILLGLALSDLSCSGAFFTFLLFFTVLFAIGFLPSGFVSPVTINQNVSITGFVLFENGDAQEVSWLKVGLSNSRIVL